MDLGPVGKPWEYRAGLVLPWLLVGGVGAVLVVGLTGAGRWVAWPSLVAVLGATLFTGTLRRRAAFKQLRGLRDIDFRVCPWCFYDLRSLDADGACPECGEPFDPETLGREWRERLEPVARGVRV